MAEKTMTMAAAAGRPLLRRVLSFREPLLVIPYLFSFVVAAASAFVGSYSSFLHAFARSLLATSARSAHAASPACTGDCDGSFAAPCQAGVEGGEDEEEDAALSRAEVEAIMERIGLAVSAVAAGEEAAAPVDVSKLFDAEEPSFGEVQRAFAVFDADRDGLIGAEDLQGALARLGVRQDADACRAMIVAGGGTDGRMSLFQFVRFLETGLC